MRFPVRLQKKDGRDFPGEDTMSAVSIDAGLDLENARGGPDEIARRLENLPISS